MIEHLCFLIFFCTKYMHCLYMYILFLYVNIFVVVDRIASKRIWMQFCVLVVLSRTVIYSGIAIFYDVIKAANGWMFKLIDKKNSKNSNRLPCWCRYICRVLKIVTVCLAGIDVDCRYRYVCKFLKIVIYTCIMCVEF